MSDAPLLPPFAEAVLDVVAEIPPGRVASYGWVARHLGWGSARQVGQAMARFGSVALWWRVVRVDGTLPPELHAQALAHYLAEGTPLASRDPLRVDGSAALP